MSEIDCFLTGSMSFQSYNTKSLNVRRRYFLNSIFVGRNITDLLALFSLRSGKYQTNTCNVIKKSNSLMQLSKQNHLMPSNLA